MASANGRGTASSQSMRFFQIVDTEQLPDYCKQYPPQPIGSCFTKWPFPETLPFRLHFQILNETGNFHRVQWNKQKACLSPRLIVNPLLKKKGQQEVGFTSTTSNSTSSQKPKLSPSLPVSCLQPVATFYMNLTLPMQGGTIDVEEEDGDICLPQTELKVNSLYEATIYVNDSLMIDRKMHKILLDGIVDTHFSIRIVRPLSAIETHSVTSIEDIVLSGVCEGSDCPQAAKRQWHVKAIYVNGSSWWLDDEEMNRFTQGRNTSTIIIAPDLLLQLSEYTQLSTCLSPTRLSPDEPDVCVILAIRTPTPCNRCVLQSPSILQDFQHVNASCSCPSAKGKFEFYAKTPDGEMTISVSEKPRFSSILPRLEGGIETCIRSRPGSNVYINTCFQSLQFVPVIQEEFKNLLQSIASGKLDILDNAVASGQPSVIFRIVHTISTQVAALMKSDFSEGSLECFNHTRNQAAKLLDKLVTALENTSVTDGETLLSMTSAIEALAANAKEVAFPTVERIQSRLAEVARVLPDILAASSRDNVLAVGHRFLHIGLHLLEGMSHQHASPTPYLRDRAPQSLDYDTDIDSPRNSLSPLIHINQT
ncbi:polycystin 1 [Echinococcus multilocularis]|uniref:Polycystin 1 n=1 Tax=Echinococcus multilocularis TaxID=6211 RepID=A0A068YBU5_ECHMU|nr:polycystin 1 [Echinococcus multilocularis]